MSNPFELDNQNYFSILNSHRNVESLYTMCFSTSISTFKFCLLFFFTTSSASRTPPTRTAYFCSVRNPGTVLRVSSTLVFPAFKASWKVCATVATPESCWIKFRSVRSPVKSLCVVPSISAIRSPFCKDFKILTLILTLPNLQIFD